MSRLIIYRGLPGSGKTTKALKHVRLSEGKVKRVNRDNLRDMVGGGGYSKPNEKAIFDLELKIIEHFLLDGYDVIDDNTNLNPDTMQALCELAQQLRVTVDVVDLTDISLNTCILRDVERGSLVGSDAITSMYNRYLKK